jgi:hypothetical protein
MNPPRAALGQGMAAGPPELGRTESTGSAVVDSIFAPTPQPSEKRQGSVRSAALLGSGIGAVGFVGGALLGRELIGCIEVEDGCSLDPMFYGAAGGGTLGMALGVHLGNRRQGNFGLDLLAASAVWATGILIGEGIDDDGAASVVLVSLPLVQLGVTIAVERATGRHRR